jgi:hypothetical protein
MARPSLSIYILLRLSSRSISRTVDEYTDARFLSSILRSTQRHRILTTVLVAAGLDFLPFEADAFGGILEGRSKQ